MKLCFLGPTPIHVPRSFLIPIRVSFGVGTTDIPVTTSDASVQVGELHAELSSSLYELTFGATSSPIPDHESGSHQCPNFSQFLDMRSSVRTPPLSLVCTDASTSICSLLIRSNPTRDLVVQTDSARNTVQSSSNESTFTVGLAVLAEVAVQVGNVASNDVSVQTDAANSLLVTAPSGTAVVPVFSALPSVLSCDPAISLTNLLPPMPGFPFEWSDVASNLDSVTASSPIGPSLVGSEDEPLHSRLAQVN